LLRQDGTILVPYTCKVSLFEHAKMCFTTLIPDASDPNHFVADPSTWMNSHPLQPGQKNWVAIEHNHNQYFISTINPLTLLKFNGTDSGQIGHLYLVYQAKSEIVLPWTSDYGYDIRGGTPAIPIKDGLYLAFFHTTVVVVHHGSRSYLMGAITFCGTPPFSIQSMSPHPILLSNFYDGPWVDYPHKNRQGIDYIMFPIGISLDDNNSTVLLSFGFDDKHGYITKFDLNQLLASMDVVAVCN
jgi:hypothetical protein